MRFKAPSCASVQFALTDAGSRLKNSATLPTCACAHNDLMTKPSTVMYDTDTKSQFVELRAKGWSLSRIAKRLNIAQRTLVDWNRQEHEQIRALRAIECEALQGKILGTHKQQ